MRESLFAAFLLILPLLPAQQALNNDSIIKMAKAGLTDDVVITTINAAPAAYDTSPDGLIALKKANISDKVIAAIVAKAVPSATPSASASRPAVASGVASAGASGIPTGVNGVGVYYQDADGAWQEILPDLVNFQSSGGLKHLFTATLIKEDCNGVIAGNRARLLLKAPVTFILYLPEGKEIEQYQLLQLHANGNARQFQYVAGGIAHQTTGALRDNVTFSSKKIAPSVYELVLPANTSQGEYGFLEPQDTSSQKTPASGKIHTFAIVD